MIRTAVCPLCRRHNIPLGEVDGGLVLTRHTIPTTVAVSPFDATPDELRVDCPLSAAVLWPSGAPTP